MRLIGLTAIVLFLGGCASRPSAPPPTPGLAMIDRSGDGAVRAEVELAPPMDRPLNVLVLSGGGAHGVWGAGVMSGWADRGDMPTWDVVTGISSGALLSINAFMADYAPLKGAWTSIKTGDVERRRWLGIMPLAIVFSDAVNDTSGLRRVLREKLTDDFIRRIARAGSGRRRLYIGTVAMAKGSFYIWDMTWLARRAAGSGKEADFDKFRDVVLASMAVPGWLPPVTIDGIKHIDGSAREQLFFRDYFVPPGSAMNLYAIENGRIGTPTAKEGGSAVSVALRGIDILNSANGDASLLEVEWQARENPKSRFYFSCEPEDSPPLTPGQFNPKELKPLFDLAYRYGREGKWKTGTDFVDTFVGPTTRPG